MKVLYQYEKLLLSHPLKTKSITSGFLFGLGDIICQKFFENNKKYNLARTFRLVTVGTVAGPIFHYWYGFLAKLKII